MTTLPHTPGSFVLVILLGQVTVGAAGTFFYLDHYRRMCGNGNDSVIFATQ